MIVGFETGAPLAVHRARPRRPGFLVSVMCGGVSLLGGAIDAAIAAPQVASAFDGTTEDANRLVSEVPAAAADVYRFPLLPTARARAASGEGRLRLAWSPFGVAVTTDGHLIYSLEVSVQGLPGPNLHDASSTLSSVVYARRRPLGDRA